MKLSEVGGVGIVTKQNATKDIPGGEYMNVKETGSDLVSQITTRKQLKTLPLTNYLTWALVKMQMCFIMQHMNLS